TACQAGPAYRRQAPRNLHAAKSSRRNTPKSKIERSGAGSDCCNRAQKTAARRRVVRAPNALAGLNIKSRDVFTPADDDFISIIQQRKRRMTDFVRPMIAPLAGCSVDRN